MGALLGVPEGVAPLLGPLKVMKGRLWGWVTPFVGDQATWSGFLYWGLWEMVERGSSNRAPISDGLHKGDLEVVLLYSGSKRYVKSLEMGVCFHSIHAFGKHGGAIFFRASAKKKKFREIFVWISKDM
jgi:hypothetical protein